MTFQTFEIEEVLDSYDYNMETSFDSTPQSSNGRCTGSTQIFTSLPSPTSSPPRHNGSHSSSTHIPTPSYTSVSPLRRMLPRRTTSSVDLSSDPAFNRQAQAPISTSTYLSPPYTNSCLNRSHPLPSPPETRGIQLLQGRFQAGGILDSPLVMRQDELMRSEKALEKPLSPPLTLPSSTLTLPEAGIEYWSAQHGDNEAQSPLVSTSQSVSDENEVSAQNGTRKDTLSDDNEETFTDLLQSEGKDLTQLSPLSPTLMSELQVEPENSALLGYSSAARRSRGLSVGQGQPPCKRNRSGPYVQTGFRSSPPWSPQSPDLELPMDFGDDAGPSNSGDFVSCLTRAGLETSSRQPGSSGSSSLPTPVSLHKADLEEVDDLWSQNPDVGPSYDFNPPFLSAFDVHELSYDTPGSPDFLNPSLFDDDYSMEVDHEKSPPFSTLPITPHYTHDPISPTALSRDLFQSIPYADPLPPPSSPSITRLNLPDFSDDESHPSSPSRRSFASLPDLEMDESLDAMDFDALPLSPSNSLLSLPGAETDDDLLPLPPPNFKTPTPPQLPGSRLLFIDDPRDVPLPRSPSPEDFDLTLVLEDDADPELMKLYNLRKKSIAAERAARHAEAQLIDAGSISLRAEATREKKKNKERSKEVGALLRIKLGDKVASPKEGGPSPSGMMGGISQLVARMMFRRHEITRPLGHRKAASTNNDYVKSSLSRPTVVDLQ